MPSFVRDHLPAIDDPLTRRVCDVCGVYSGAPRGAGCSTCAVGTMRYLSELQVLRSQRRTRRLAELAETSSRTVGRGA